LHQLLFIILLTISLIILTYLTLTWTQPVKWEQRSPMQRRWFAFEAAPELFRYVEPELYLAPNSLKLTRNSPVKITAYWRLSREHWRETEKNPEELAREGRLTLRLYRSGDLLEIEDVPIYKTSGSQQVNLYDDCSCCASLGIKADDHFTPWLFSNTLMRQPAMESHERKRF